MQVNPQQLKAHSAGKVVKEGDPQIYERFNVWGKAQGIERERERER